LAYEFPSTTEELDAAAQGFEVRCNTGICCFARWLLLQVPSIGETGNVKSYFFRLEYSLTVIAKAD